MKLELKILSRKKSLEIKNEENQNMESMSENIFEQIDIDIKKRAQAKINLKLSELIAALKLSSYKGEEYEDLIDASTFYNWERIKNETQASDNEIEKALSKYTIAVMNGFYRLVDYDFEIQAMILMLGEYDEKSWELDEVDKEMLHLCLKEDIPFPIFDVIFQKYTDPSVKKKLDESQLYKFNVPKATRLLALILLSENPQNKFDEFLKAWELVCPNGMQPKLEYLYGMAITTWNSKTLRKEIKFFPESKLPDDLCERFKALFSTEEQWTYEEIRPYLLKYVSRQEPLSSILSTYAIQMQENGVKFYISKTEECKLKESESKELD